ncbi:MULTISPECIES: LysM peptidoglycan-binding domain-containing protein [Corallococcus]|uniref:LysM peptidoglycan-binding domain-containing protein n=1 Tax=Corallococcus TaxID=83461 RepID=UPI00163DCB14|nr:MULTISPECIES: LysM peptidoglycan-binding domain-containing protein [Corallococcus]
MSNYRIRPGDTLSALAQRFGTSVSKLARDNNIANPNLIYSGRTLRIGHSGRDSFDAGGGRQGLRGGGHSGGGRSGGVGGGADVGGPTGAGPSNASAAMRRLAQAGRAAAMGMGGYNSQGLCATGVSRALRNALGISVSGNGNQIDNNLPRDKFKQVNMSLEEALKIPGLVLTWERTSSAAGSIYGHTAITTGDGHSSASDFIERNTTNNGRTGFKVFMPTV